MPIYRQSDYDNLRWHIALHLESQNMAKNHYDVYIKNILKIDYESKAITPDDIRNFLERGVNIKSPKIEHLIAFAHKVCPHYKLESWRGRDLPEEGELFIHCQGYDFLHHPEVGPIVVEFIKSMSRYQAIQNVSWSRPDPFNKNEETVSE